MKKRFTIPALLLIHLFCNAQTEKVTVGITDSLYSAEMKQGRKILVYTPDMTSGYKNPGSRYPVLYLLDGPSHFISTVGLLQQLSQVNGNAVLPEMIIVGVEHTNRNNELSPSKANEQNRFVDFIGTELIPYIERTYQASGYRVLIGHSLGGLTAIDILTHKPGMFNAYLAIDPSLWYDNERSLRDAIAAFPRNNFKNAKLFIGTANTMPPGMTLSKLAKDSSAKTQHIRSIFKFDKFLQSRNIPGLIYSHRYYAEENHISVPLISEYDGLKAIFNYYPIKVSEDDFTDPTPKIANKYNDHYRRISRELGYNVGPPEAFIAYLAHDALSKKQYDKADALFKMNTVNYPGSSTVYDSYADFFITKGDTGRAAAMYKKSLFVKDDPGVRGKLQLITQQTKFTMTEQELSQYSGDYIIEAYDLPMKIELRTDVLWTVVPGQADSELLPLSKDIFTIKNTQGYFITFHRKGEQITGFTSVQPNGTFKISKK